MVSVIHASLALSNVMGEASGFFIQRAIVKELFCMKVLYDLITTSRCYDRATAILRNFA